MLAYKLFQVIAEVQAMGGKRVSTISFIERAIKVHGSKYNYSKSIFNGSKENITIICNSHGEFNQLPYNHLKGKGCMKCRLEKSSERYMYSQDEAVSKFTEKHKGFYDYSLVEYKGSKKKIKIICPNHGVFEQYADAHMVGKGCDLCSRQLLNYRKSDYVERCRLKHNGKSNFYILKMIEDDGKVFFKIGITTQAIKYRYRENKTPYSYDILKLISANAESVFDLELKIKKLMLNDVYSPLKKFDGSRYECFSHIPDDVYMMIDSLVLCEYD